MSYILDALKKTEQEKARKARGPGISGVTGALFDESPARPPIFAGWKVAALIAVLAMSVTFAVTWLVLRPTRQSAKAVPKPTSQAAVPAPTAPLQASLPPVPVTTPAAPAVPPALPVAVVAPQTRSAAQPAVAVPQAPTKAAVKPAVPSAAAVKTEPVRPPQEDPAVHLTMQELGKRSVGRKLTADQMIAPPADIMLSGIAWQDERRARRAVVNGFLMQEGGMVSGARIVEIYQDRVRFSMAGKYFDLNLVSASAPAPTR